jgi:DNA-binding CsgD family transcriptional regulator
VRERQIAGWASLGHSNKLIAYELGLPLSTIATHLRRAVRKLGLRKTAELGQLFFDPKTIRR